MNTDNIYDFLTNYNLINRVSCYKYITEIKSQKNSLTSEELNNLVAKYRSDLQEDFNSNLQKTIDKLNFDKNIEVKNPYAENKKINLLDLMIHTTINADRQWILEYFDKEISNL